MENQFKNELDLYQGFIIPEGSAAAMIISDGNTGPSGASPAHLLCHGSRAYREPCQIQADRKKSYYFAQKLSARRNWRGSRYAHEP